MVRRHGTVGQLTGGEALCADGSRIVLIAFYSLPHLYSMPSKCMLAMANKSALAPKTKFESLLLRT